jgi:hypothetical protein
MKFESELFPQERPEEVFSPEQTNEETPDHTFDEYYQMLLDAKKEKKSGTINSLLKRLYDVAQTDEEIQRIYPHITYPDSSFGQMVTAKHEKIKGYDPKKAA